MVDKRFYLFGRNMNSEKNVYKHILAVLWKAKFLVVYHPPYSCCQYCFNYLRR